MAAGRDWTCPALTGLIDIFEINIQSRIPKKDDSSNRVIISVSDSSKVILGNFNFK